MFMTLARFPGLGSGFPANEVKTGSANVSATAKKVRRFSPRSLVIPGLVGVGLVIAASVIFPLPVAVTLSVIAAIAVLAACILLMGALCNRSSSSASSSPKPSEAPPTPESAAEVAVPSAAGSSPSNLERAVGIGFDLAAGTVGQLGSALVVSAASAALRSYPAVVVIGTTAAALAAYYLRGELSTISLEEEVPSDAPVLKENATVQVTKENSGLENQKKRFLSYLKILAMKQTNNTISLEIVNFLFNTFLPQNIESIVFDSSETGGDTNIKFTIELTREISTTLKTLGDSKNAWGYAKEACLSSKKMIEGYFDFDKNSLVITNNTMSASKHFLSGQLNEIRIQDHHVIFMGKALMSGSIPFTKDELVETFKHLDWPKS